MRVCRGNAYRKENSIPMNQYIRFFFLQRAEDYPTGMNRLQSASGFPVMAVLAKGLPVFFIPEQSHITPVRNDVVNDRGRCQPAFRFANDA